MEASQTAVVTALMRGIHSRRGRPPLIDDLWGERLVSDEERAALCRRILADASSESRQRLARLDSDQLRLDAALSRHPTYGGVILRSRYAEDALASAVERGIRQYVLIGAGLDSFFARQPAFARYLRIFEIDQPATQASKLQRIAAADLEIPDNVCFVAADLDREALGEVLVAAGFSPAVPALFSWLGVTMYLSREANLATLRAIAESSAPGSELIFTYIDQAALEAPALRAMLEKRASRGEPWVSGFDPATLSATLSSLGLTLLEDLGGGELVSRYCAGRGDGLSAGAAGHTVRACVGADA